MGITVNLNKMEYRILAMLADDIEPVHMIYADIHHEFINSTINQIVKAIISLINRGLAECYLAEDNRRKKIEGITEQILLQRFRLFEQKEWNVHPHNFPEYYFKITVRGETEVKRKIYDQYQKN